MRAFFFLIASALVLSLLFCGCAQQQCKADTSVNVSKADFENTLSSADRVTIIMDLRGAPSAARDKILQCGVDLAGSQGLVGKNLTILAFDGDKCIGSPINGSICDCYSKTQGSTVLQAQYGAEQPEFYNNTLVIGINENSSTGCDISPAASQ